MTILLICTISAILLSVLLGTRLVGPGELLAFLSGRSSKEVTLLLMDFRLPRLLMGLLAGMGLSVSGAIMQALCRNDLATPGLLGISAAGRVGVVVTVALAPGMIGPWILPAISFSGAMVIALVVMALSLHRGQIDPMRMLLVGLAMSMVLGALGDVISAFLPATQFDFITAWLSGTLARATWNYTIVLAAYMAVLLPLAWMGANALNVITLGDDAATGLGLPVNRSRIGWTAVAVMLTAVCAAFGTTLTFLGLLGPHIARKTVGQNCRAVIPASALTGGLLVVVADTLCRVCFQTNELPVGVMVSVLGGIYFLMLLMRDPQ